MSTQTACCFDNRRHTLSEREPRSARLHREAGVGDRHRVPMFGIVDQRFYKGKPSHNAAICEALHSFSFSSSDSPYLFNFFPPDFYRRTLTPARGLLTNKPRAVTSYCNIVFIWFWVSVGALNSAYRHCKKARGLFTLTFRCLRITLKLNALLFTINDAFSPLFRLHL